uniref:Uncharacterized protein n=1 Tax=Meloidogyne enterolobii TaxID=390850 RepID=A0A6V7WG46_MELEN|nr:unnamed protein product [Meloidogyne enterolobii]
MIEDEIVKNLTNLKEAMGNNSNQLHYYCILKEPKFGFILFNNSVLDDN